MNVTRKRAGQPGWWVLSALLVGVILLLSSGSNLPVAPVLDWLLHTVTYLALGFCFGRATGNWSLTLVGLAWFAALNGLHMAFTPPREATVADWLFAVAAGSWGAWLAERSLTVIRYAPNLVLDVQFDELPLSAD